MKTQLAMYRDANQRLTDRAITFIEIMRGPNPLTPSEFEALCAKRPEVYGQFRGLFVTLCNERKG